MTWILVAALCAVSAMLGARHLHRRGRGAMDAFVRGGPVGLRLVVGLPLLVGQAQAADKRASAVRRVGEIRVDGRLDEPDWARAPASTGFWQREPDEGEAPDHQTEFRVLFDEEALYIGVRAHDDEPTAIRALLTRRDQSSSSDWIYVGIDSYADRRTAFVFGLNAAGVQHDMVLFDDTNSDDSWNAVWTGATSVDDQGWVAEFRVPLRQLRFTADTTQAWGFQIRRVVQRTGEETWWSPTPRNKPRVVSLFGRLDGVALPERMHRLELLPYFIGGAKFPAAAADDPFGDGAEPQFRSGLDFKYGVTNNLTLSGTINPDFGQVDADPSQINLTAQEVFFRERRPFFLEGADIIQFRLSQGDGDGAQDTLFYSRRIGRAPQGSGADYGDYYRQDPTTSIFGAAKLTGKTSRGWSIGLMDALTAQEMADIRHTSGVHERAVVEPMTNYAVGRVRKDLNEGRTTIGIAGTAVNRQLEGTPFRDDLHEAAYASGMEFSHRFAGDMWNANAKLAGSHVRGSPEAIEITQRASQRFFQRPDAEHVHVDETRESLSGLAMVGDVGRTGGQFWRFAVGVDARTPGFEVNDVGFQREADFAVGWVWTQFRDQRPSKHVREYFLNLNAWSVSNWQPENLTNGANVNGSITFNNLWGGWLGYATNFNRVNPGLLRGGPSVRADVWHNANLGIRSDERRRARGNLIAYGGASPAQGSWELGSNLDFSVLARSNLELSLGPSFSQRLGQLQYVTATEDAEAVDHYVLGRIQQTTLGVTLRVNYTITRNLSMQIYAQPFTSSGRYDQFKEPDDHQAQDFDDRFHVLSGPEIARADDEYTVTRAGYTYTFDAPDFDFRELRSNFVLRWEYVPGSTLSFIWSQGRAASGSDGRFDVARDIEDMADAEGEHVLLLKLGHWFGG
ncbi:MAG: carbohydrate binding family 9 domain-containing protein [Myxococcales bacterium FL481]|nr:MAG: carbohydrate binding family 9 domain-containing protein [Myxococcales bacterium FL481]